MELNISTLIESFFNSTIQIAFPWLIAMAAVIILDLIVGVKKALFIGEEVRFGNALRRTFTKSVGYFWLVITVGFIDSATTVDLKITTWSCLIVCAIELSSTISNFLKMKGYKFNKEKGIDFILNKTMKRFGVGGIEKGEFVDLIEKIDKEKKEDK